MSVSICNRCGGEEMLCRVRKECIDRAYLESGGEITLKPHDVDDYTIIELRCRVCGEVFRDEDGVPITTGKGLMAFYYRHEAAINRFGELDIG